MKFNTVIGIWLVGSGVIMTSLFWAIGASQLWTVLWIGIAASGLLLAFFSELQES